MNFIRIPLDNLKFKFPKGSYPLNPTLPIKCCKNVFVWPNYWINTFCNFRTHICDYLNKTCNFALLLTETYVLFVDFKHTYPYIEFQNLKPCCHIFDIYFSIHVNLYICIAIVFRILLHRLPICISIDAGNEKIKNY